MADRWQFAAPGGLESPGEDIVPITPDDDNDLAEPVRTLVVDGPVRVTTHRGQVRDLPDPGGLWEWRVRAVRVHAAGTDAGIILGYV